MEGSALKVTLIIGITILKCAVCPVNPSVLGESALNQHYPGK